MTALEELQAEAERRGLEVRGSNAAAKRRDITDDIPLCVHQSHVFAFLYSYGVLEEQVDNHGFSRRELVGRNDVFYCRHCLAYRTVERKP